MSARRKPTKSKSYSFVVEATISLHIEVEATSLEEAIAGAQEASVMSLCHQCARGDRGEWSTSGELDCGDPSSAPLVQVCVGDEMLEGTKLAAAQAKWLGES